MIPESHGGAGFPRCERGVGESRGRKDATHCYYFSEPKNQREGVGSESSKQDQNDDVSAVGENRFGGPRKKTHEAEKGNPKKFTVPFSHEWEGGVTLSLLGNARDFGVIVLAVEYSISLMTALGKNEGKPERVRREERGRGKWLFVSLISSRTEG